MSHLEIQFVSYKVAKIEIVLSAIFCQVQVLMSRSRLVYGVIILSQ